MVMAMSHFLTALESDISQMFPLSVMYPHLTTAVISAQAGKFNKEYTKGSMLPLASLKACVMLSSKTRVHFV